MTGNRIAALCICFIALRCFAQSDDPYVHLERMYAKLNASTSLHVRVVVAGSNEQGKQCRREVYESYHTQDRLRSIQPGSEMLVTENAFVLVDRAAKTIEFRHSDTPKAPRARNAAEALQGLDSLRKVWHQATVMSENDSLIRYAYRPAKGAFRSVEIELDKRTDLLRHIGYTLRHDGGDGCPIIDLTYELLDADGRFPESVFGIEHYVQRTREGDWRPSRAFSGYTIHRPPGS